ncbi:glycosyltransferase family 4 protein [Pseudomonadota bacterium]
MLSNFYPPNHIGGYELGCSKIVDQLRERGHECIVLTSDFGVKRAVKNGEVLRVLEHSFNETDKPRRLGRIRSLVLDIKNRRIVKKEIQRISPDLVFIFNPMYLTPGVLVQAIHSAAPTCCLVSDEWLCHWEKKDNRHYSRLFSLHRKGLLDKGLEYLYKFLGITSEIRLPAINEAIFVSEYLKKRSEESGVDVQKSIVIHWGVDRERFLTGGSDQRRPTKILFCGQVSPHKGPDTVIRALAIVRAHLPGRDIELSIAGSFVDPDYEESLNKMVASKGLDEYVHFLGATAHESIPSVMRVHDIYAFPSVWEEPFSISLVEAMTSGMAVVATQTGGTGEILQDGFNGLQFEVNNPESCASAILKLLNNQELCKNLSKNAVDSTRHLTIERMSDKLEQILLRAARYGCLGTS